jgi:hypothetical protein
MFNPVANSIDWCLFIDSSKVSLTAVLLHNENKFPSVPLAHTTNMKQSYKHMKTILQKIQYEKYNWNFGGDLKVNALLSFVAFCVNEIVGTENVTLKNSRLNKNHLFQDISTMQKWYQGMWSPSMLADYR